MKYEKQAWISVEEQLPEPFKRVLVFREGGIVEQGHRETNGWWKVYGSRIKRVSHWMPLPEGPNEDNRTVTNGERIRNMTDEELAKAVLEASDSGVYTGFCRELPRCVQELDEDGVPEERCLECVKLWLNSPTEEEKA